MVLIIHFKNFLKISKKNYTKYASLILIFAIKVIFINPESRLGLRETIIQSKFNSDNYLFDLYENEEISFLL